MVDPSVRNAFAFWTSKKVLGTTCAVIHALKPVAPHSFYTFSLNCPSAKTTLDLNELEALLSQLDDRLTALENGNGKKENGTGDGSGNALANNF